MSSGAASKGRDRRLLLQIARCPMVARCLNGDLDHPCSRIVRSQGVNLSEFQSPEPWSGHLSVAPILFLSSNPSIGSASYDQYPRATWDDESISAYFEHRFGGHRLSSVDQGIYHISPGAARAARGIRYWIAVRARAAELLGRSPSQVVAGTDYALTEAVRCKSRSEFGVAEALATCVGEYLEPTLAASVAQVIVVLGRVAKRAVCGMYGLEPDKLVHGPILIGDRQRLVVFLPHPTGFARRKTFSGCLHPSELEQLRGWLRSPRHHSTV
jgi:hypothetical protein